MLETLPSDKKMSRSRGPVLVVLFLMAIQPLGVFVLSLLAPTIFASPSQEFQGGERVSDSGSHHVERIQELQGGERVSDSGSHHAERIQEFQGGERVGDSGSHHAERIQELQGGKHVSGPGTHHAERPQAPHSHHEEHEEENMQSWGVAATLITMIIFVMTLMHLLNAKEKFVRKYTYEVLSFTISIFCSVLLFHAVSELVHEVFVEEEEGRTFWVDVVQCLLWFTILELLLASCTGMFGGKSFFDRLSVMQFAELKKNVKCFAVLMSHMTGFAAMHTWCTLQQTSPFNQSSLWSISVLPLAAVFHAFAALLSHRIRHCVQTGDGTDVDKFEELWNDGTADAENDIVGLVLSQLLVNTVRFEMSDRLPDDEGLEHGNCGENLCMVDHTLGEASILVMFAVACCLVASIFFWFAHNEPEESQDVRRDSVLFIDEGADDSEWTRLQLIASTVFSMAFAFGMFSALSYFVAIFGQFPQDQQMIFQVLVAFVSSGFGAVGILTLCVIMRSLYMHSDLAAARMQTKISQSIVSGLGILVGFSWERCFGEAVTVLAEDAKSPGTIKLLLAITCTVLLVPAWRFYMLPIVMDQGWRYGFVVNYHWHRETHALQGHIEQVIDHLHAQQRNLKREPGHGPQPVQIQLADRSRISPQAEHLQHTSETLKEPSQPPWHIAFQLTPLGGQT